MTTLQDVLESVADQARPIDGLAERAAAQAAERRGFFRTAKSPKDRALRTKRAGRTRRKTIVAGLAAAVSVTSVIALVTVASPLLMQGDPEPARQLPAAQTIRIPKTAPPLPAQGIGAAKLAYQPKCKQVKGCNWRVMTPAGKHYRIDDAAHSAGATFTIRSGDDPRPVMGSLSLAPDGKRAAYLRPNGALVIRDLGSDKVTEVVRWSLETLQNYAGPGATWSPDGRYLLVTLGQFIPDLVLVDGKYTQEKAPGAEPSSLVDTQTMHVTKLRGSCCSFGLPNADSNSPFPFGPITTKPVATDLLDWNGKRVGRLPARLFPNQKVDGMLGKISADGKTFAAITYLDLGGSFQVTIVDVTTQRIKKTYQVKERQYSPGFVGWFDETRVLVSRRGPLPEAKPGGDPGLRQYEGVDVNALDITTGRTTGLIHFPDQVFAFSVATGLL